MLFQGKYPSSISSSGMRLGKTILAADSVPVKICAEVRRCFDCMVFFHLQLTLE